jgi:hypothetical protein
VDPGEVQTPRLLQTTHYFNEFFLFYLPQSKPGQAHQKQTIKVSYLYHITLRQSQLRPLRRIYNAVSLLLVDLGGNAPPSAPNYSLLQRILLYLSNVIEP